MSTLRLLGLKFLAGIISLQPKICSILVRGWVLWSVLIASHPHQCKIFRDFLTDIKSFYRKSLIETGIYSSDSVVKVNLFFWQKFDSCDRNHFLWAEIYSSCGRNFVLVAWILFLWQEFYFCDRNLFFCLLFL